MTKLYVFPLSRCPMTARAAHIAAPYAPCAADSDAGLRGGLDFIAMAEAALAHGGPAARRGAVRALGWIDGNEPDATIALGMTGPGRRHPRQVLRRMRRDDALRALWRAHWPDLGPTAAAGLIHKKWRRYAETGWRRHERAGTEPAADPDAALHALMRAGHKPLAAERLRKLLSENGRFAPVEPTTLCDDL